MLRILLQGVGHIVDIAVLYRPYYGYYCMVEVILLILLYCVGHIVDINAQCR
jgi:hypothetical protein